MNRRWMALCAGLLACGSAYAVTPVEAYGQLRVEGRYIVSSRTGQPVQLTGMCLFWSQWSGELWNASVANWLADDWKCTVLRLSMGVELGGYLENPTTEMNRVKTMVDACIARGIYVIIDWHVENADPHETQATAFFKEMARLYGNQPNVMYELWNEPHTNPWSYVRDYANRVTAEIRKIDPDNIVCVATPNWDRLINNPVPDRVSDANSVYVCHFYAASDGVSLRSLINRCAEVGELPMFVTEWGTSEGTGDGRIDTASTRAFWDVLDKWKIGHTNWSIVHKNESSAAITVSAPNNGNWGDAHLTASGRFVRAKLLSYPDVTVGVRTGALRIAPPAAAPRHPLLVLVNGRLVARTAQPRALSLRVISLP